jgi:fatty acid CoA ligase FadD9
MVTRLLLSLIVTGIAPGSFYRAAGRAHYAGLPADFIADAITTVGAATTKDYETYNMLNPHDDDISLDTYVDWLIDAGYPITRIDDYDEWSKRFEAVIRALPQQQKQHSLLQPLPTPPNPSRAPTSRWPAPVPRRKKHDSVLTTTSRT